MERRTCVVVLYGMPHGSASGAGVNKRKYSGKELITFSGYDAMDYHARWRPTALPLFTTPDPMCEKTYPISLYAYCGGDPVNRVDPTGCIIEGVSKKDAAMAVEDFRAMFPGDEFANFRNLIVRSGKKQKGKSFAPISSESLSAAFSGVSLNEDQQALVEMVVNTINSDDVHRVEYIQGKGVLSNQATESFLPGFMYGGIGVHMPAIMERRGGLPIDLIINEGGGGVTTPTPKGSHSLIVLNGEHLNGIAVTTGHEIIGHGRSLALGRGDINQHVDAIQTENLILRVMGIPYVNTGENHGKDRTPIPEPSLLPSFR